MKSFTKASSQSKLLVFIHSGHLWAHECESILWSDIFVMQVCVPIISPLLGTWCVHILYSESSTELEWNIRTFRTNRGHKYFLREMNSCSADSLKDKFPSFWWNLKRASICISYNKAFNYLSVRGRSWILTKLSRMVCLPYLTGMREVYLLRGMTFFLNLQLKTSVKQKRTSNYMGYSETFNHLLMRGGFEFS